MNLEAEAKKPWDQRNRWMIAREWPTYQKYRGLPDLPKGAVFAGEGHAAGTKESFEGWYKFFDDDPDDKGYWRRCFGNGGVDRCLFARPLDYLLPDAPPDGTWDEWEWAWGKDENDRSDYTHFFYWPDPVSGWQSGGFHRRPVGVEGESFNCLFARRKEPVRTDPPELEWPAPPEGHQAVARGYGWEPGRKCRYCFYHEPSGKWYYKLWQENIPEGEEESFYLEAVPLDPAPFDGPEDFQTARCRWPILKFGDVIICPSEITNNGVRIDGVLRSWKSLKDFGFQYSGGINGPWEKFEKGSASE